MIGGAKRRYIAPVILGHLLYVVSSFDVLAQQTSSPQHDTAFSFTFENDLFFGTDRYYTDGVQISVRRKVAPKGDTVNAVIDLACRTFGCGADDFQQQEFKVGQLMYTPANIASPLPQPTDRPWAGMLYFATSADFLATDDRTLTTLEAMLGIIGPYSYADRTQKWIHSTFNHTTPQGWDNQIGSELGFLAMVERRHAWGAWGGPSPDDVQGRTSYYWRAAAGNIMTYAGAGATLTLGKHLPLVAGREAGGIVLKDKRRDDRTSETRSPSTGCLFQWLRCTAFASVEARWMLRNVFLDGRAFANDPSVKRRPLVGEVSAGARLDLPTTSRRVLGPWFVQFKATRRSPEFEAPSRARPQTFGALTIGTDF